MQYFHYKALKHDGTVIEGTGEGRTRPEFITQLKGQGLIVINTNVVTRRGSKQFTAPRNLLGRFYSMLSNQLQVGVPILSALQVIEKQERSPGGKELVRDIAKRIESGQTLSESLEAHPDLFSIIDMNLICAGEEGGFLPEAVDRIAYIREWQQKLKSSAWGAAAYPLLLVCIAAILVPSMLIFLVPKLEPVFASLRQDAQLPWATSALLWLSHNLEQHVMQFIAAGIFFISIIYLTVPQQHLKNLFDRLVLRLPLIGELVRDFILARFFRILGTLLQNKIPIVKSIHIATKVLNNHDMEKAFQPLSEAVSSGRHLAMTLDKTGRVPPDILAMIGVAEQSNALDSVLIKIAEQLEYRTNRRLEIVVKLIEPMLLLVMATFVGFVVLALLLPIFEGQTLG